MIAGARPKAAVERAHPRTSGGVWRQREVGLFVNEISAWLEHLGLGQYAAAFVQNAIGLDVLPDLTEADFKRLGVPLGHQKRILKALVGTGAAAQTATTSTHSTIGSEPEKRLLTVLFCDLVGSTALAVQLDAEDLSTVIRRFQTTCANVVISYGGYVAKFLGDGLLAYFGYPVTREDEAENAVRAGLDLIAKVGRLLLPAGESLQARVGIATGVVVVASNTFSGSADEVAATGEPPNLAARLQEVAGPNMIVVSEVTRKLLGGGFVCERLGPQKLKGFSEPINAHKVIGETALDSRFDARVGSKLTQLVGRERELVLLTGLWKRAKAGEGQIALICGEPGIGKSRICSALLDDIEKENHATIRWQCSSHHTNSPLYPVIRNLERAARFDRDDNAEVRVAKLESLLAQFGQSSLANAPLLAALLSIPNVGRYPSLDLTPQRQKELTIKALIHQALAYSPKQPVLFLVEDVHWMDPTSLELVNRTIEAIKSVPFLALLTFRPDFFAPWLHQPHVTLLRLEKLGQAEVGAMITDLTAGKGLPAEVADIILSKTDGVPLFVEELTKAILETGMLEDAGDRYVLHGEFVIPSIPVTLHDSLLARLDRLAPIKEVAQIGAAIGREFSYRLLAAIAPVAPSSLDSALAQLMAADLIHSRGQPPDSSYVFKHALVQDAAYGSLLRSKRQALHSNIADALKAQFPDVVETQPELMAHHLEQAGLPGPAIEYLRLAGQRAIERSANAEAIGHLKRAIELLESTADDASRQSALRLELLLAQAMIAGRGYAAPETQKAFLRARGLVDEWTKPELKFAALYGLWASYYVGGEVSKQRPAALEFLGEAERHGLPSAVCLSRRTLGTTFVQMGDFEAGRRHLEKAKTLYEQGLESAQPYQFGQDIGAAALCYLAWAQWQLGYVDQAVNVAARAVHHAKSLNHPFTLVYTICHAQGMIDIMRRHPSDTHAYAQKVISLCTEHAFPFWGAGGQILDGWATSHADPDKGVEQIRTGLDAWRKTGARLWLPVFIAIEGEAHAAAGRSDAALLAIEQAIRISGDTGERWTLAEIIRLKAQILLKSGRGEADEIEALLHESLETARLQGARSWRLRAACDLVRIQRGRRRERDALKLLRSIYREFTEGFGTPDLMDAEALLKVGPSRRPKTTTAGKPRISRRAAKAARHSERSK
jgi:class 3 adenylate cyclase/tetratricopeptide (TPR) repeat protein